MISYGVGLPSQTSRTNNKGVISTFNFGYPRLTLKEGPKVKSVHTRRFPANDFLYVGLPSQTSRTDNKQVISTFNFDFPRLTLKVKSDNIRRFAAHDFLKVGFTLQTSRPNNKGDIGTFKVRCVGYFGTPWMTLN